VNRLRKEDRLGLDEQLALLTKADWQNEAADARPLARQMKLDQAAIDQGLDSVRCSR
jgi:hypothetical protein